MRKLCTHSHVPISIRVEILKQSGRVDCTLCVEMSLLRIGCELKMTSNTELKTDRLHSIVLYFPLLYFTMLNTTFTILYHATYYYYFTALST